MSTMNRQEILDMYNVTRHGTIVSAGMFEGEMIYAPALYNIALDGCCEYEDCVCDPGDDDDGCFECWCNPGTIVEIDDDLRREFPELSEHATSYIVRVSDQGFVFCTARDE